MKNKKALFVATGILILVAAIAIPTFDYVQGNEGYKSLSFAVGGLMLLAAPLAIIVAFIIALVKLTSKFTSKSVTSPEKETMFRRLVIVILIIASIVSFTIFLNGLYNDFIVYR